MSMGLGVEKLQEVIGVDEVAVLGSSVNNVVHLEVNRESYMGKHDAVG